MDGAVGQINITAVVIVEIGECVFHPILVISLLVQYRVKVVLHERRNSMAPRQLNIQDNRHERGRHGFPFDPTQI